ncbi:MAG: SDR family oxidoreductase [Hyphomicrobiaceae bacterium]|nr:SDR family oxidoreductase [Hyphomicrobiaceae bacterium]
MSVESKIAVVTGGASGIGRAVALRLGEKGARVVVADRNLAGAEEVAQCIKAVSGDAMAMHVDVSVPSSVGRMLEETLAGVGQIDALVHCAGICPRCDVLEMDDTEWRMVLGVNLDGAFYVGRAVGRAMAKRGTGTMIMLTSDRGSFGSADYAHYAASKGGLIALTKSLALALGKYGVTVNGINPGFTDTPLARSALTEEDWAKRHQSDPLGRHSKPEEIAEIALFLAGVGGRFMTGQIVTTRMRS